MYLTRNSPGDLKRTLWVVSGIFIQMNSSFTCSMMHRGINQSNFVRRDGEGRQESFVSESCFSFRCWVQYSLRVDQLSSQAVVTRSGSLLLKEGASYGAFIKLLGVYNIITRKTQPGCGWYLRWRKWQWGRMYVIESCRMLHIKRKVCNFTVRFSTWQFSVFASKPTTAIPNFTFFNLLQNMLHFHPMSDSSGRVQIYYVDMNFCLSKFVRYVPRGGLKLLQVLCFHITK